MQALLLLLSSLGFSSGKKACVSSFSSDPKAAGLVELILQVGAGQLSEQRKGALVRRLAALLSVLDSDVRVQKVQAHSDLRYGRSVRPDGVRLLSCSVPLNTFSLFVSFIFFPQRAAARA